MVKKSLLIFSLFTFSLFAVDHTTSKLILPDDDYKFTEKEVIEALENYLVKNGEKIPQGKVYLSDISQGWDFYSATLNFDPNPPDPNLYSGIAWADSGVNFDKYPKLPLIEHKTIPPTLPQENFTFSKIAVIDALRDYIMIKDKSFPKGEISLRRFDERDGKQFILNVDPNPKETLVSSTFLLNN